MLRQRSPGGTAVAFVLRTGQRDWISGQYRGAT